MDDWFAPWVCTVVDATSETKSQKKLKPFEHKKAAECEQQPGWRHSRHRDGYFNIKHPHKPYFRQGFTVLRFIFFFGVIYLTLEDGIVAMGKPTCQGLQPEWQAEQVEWPSVTFAFLFQGFENSGS